MFSSCPAKRETLSRTAGHIASVPARVNRRDGRRTHATGGQTDLVDGRPLPVESDKRAGRRTGHKGYIFERESMMSYASAIVTFSLLVTAASAAAAEPSTKDQTKYCVQIEASTGSRINKPECRPKAEWAQLGVDVD